MIKNNLRLRYTPFHILFFSLSPPLMLLVHNLGEAQLSESLRPLSFAVLLALLSLFAFRWLAKDWIMAGLFTTFSLLLFFSYGHVYEYAKGLQILDTLVGRHRFLISLWGVCFTLGVFILSRMTHHKREFTVLLNGLGLALLLIQLLQLANYELRSHVSRRQAESSIQTTLLAPPDRANMPDVYLIILDMYGRADALEAHYDYDNREFVSQLEDLGFFVAKCGRSNYSKTVLSLPSQLNLDYVDTLVDNPDHEKYAYLLKNSIVQNAFTNIGYTTIAFDTGAGWANLDKSDIFIDRPPKILGRGLEGFEELFLKTTLARPLLDYAAQLDRAGFHFFETGVEMKAQRIRIVLDHLLLLPEDDGPKFVYAHIITPHPPHVFNPDGSVNLNAEFVDGQIGLPIQLDYLNPQIVEIARNIIESSAEEPIIIIEGDHGFANLQRTSILLAMYLPGNGDMNLYPSLTLVNTFRIIFNTYFGTDLPLLEDKAFKMLNDSTLNYAPHPEWNPDCLPQ